MSYHHANRRKRRRDMDPDVAAVREVVRDAVLHAAGSDDVLLISHEDLGVGATAARLTKFLRVVAGRDTEITFVAYVRHPVSMYPSSIQQMLKSNRDRTLLPQSWINPHIRRSAQLRQRLDSALVLRPFAPPGVENWDVIEDFREVVSRIVGRSLPSYVPDRGVNTSLSANACAILEAARSISDPDPARRDLSRVVRAFDQEHGGVRLRLPPGWAQDIATTNANGWNAVVPHLECSDDSREALRLEVEPEPRQYEDGDIRRWLLSGLDRDWCEDLVRHAAQDGATAGLASWIERNLLAHLDAIKASS